MHVTRPMPRHAEPQRPQRLEAQAMDNLRFIRQTMEHAASFTAVPGWGQVAVGATALVAAAVAAMQTQPTLWFVVWIVESVIALVIGVTTMLRKSRAAGIPLVAGGGRRFLATFSLPMIAAAMLTVVLFREGLVHLLPGMWLLLYGTAFAIGGAFSVRSIPVMGGCFMALGVAALFTPPAWGNVWMATGYGGLHLVFGWIIARRHGG